MAGPSWSTNGASVYRLSLSRITNSMWPPGISRFTNDASGKRVLIRGPYITFATNDTFDHFVPGSLPYHLWTNVVAHTNGTSLRIWSMRYHPPGWPKVDPKIAWNTNCIMWGMRGLTALSPCWEVESGDGQIAVTALTRRHGYARGHDMGPSGLRTAFAGKRVWFLTTNDTLVKVTVVREIVRCPTFGNRAQSADYTLLLFDRDLPDSIQPIRVAANVSEKLGTAQLAFRSSAPLPLFLTGQDGRVSTGLPGLTFDTRRGGDSGLPNMLPLPGELVFYGGRATSSPSPEMQADMDELCRAERLDPRKYQMQWVDLSAFPTY